MRNFKRIVAIVAVAIVIAVICLNFGIKPTAKKELMTVVIDAGHGGIDGGVTGVNTGVKESDLNLIIAKDLEANFKAGGFNVVMTRTSNGGLYGVMSEGFKMRDMKKRKEIINSAHADVMISVHLNFFSSPNRRGAQVFYKIGDEKSLALAKSIQSELNITEREYSPLGGDFYVLNESNCTSVLCECGFLSNPQDEALLITEEYRAKISELIYLGTVKEIFPN